MLAYSAILVAALGGLFAMPVWIVALVATALHALSYHRYQSLYEEAGAAGLLALLDRTRWASMLNALAASAAAYIGGWAISQF